jgi:valyl-tRNA synthetase
VNETAPEGCAIITVSDKCQVNLLLKGLIEPAKEVAKIEKKLEFLQGTKNKLNQAISAADYTTKVPPEVQQANSEKLTQTTVELERLQAAIEALKSME